jgi:molybdopterin molybdotransferase
VASDLITIVEARRRVLGAIVPLPTETVPVESALDRVLAQDVVADGDLPPFASSAMDGYAIEPGPAGRMLAILGESRAGAPAGHPLDPGGAIRISTGAAVPDGAGAVIRQEDTEAHGDRVLITADAAPGANVRQPGEDQRAGATVLSAGTRLGPSELGAAVGAGAGELTVGGHPRLAVLCTGDELRAPGEPLAPGQIHNSNAPMLVALGIRSHAALSGYERIRDDPAATERALAAALGVNDVIVVSGGVSVGPHDHVKPALEALGVTQRFWGVSLQPGKPTWFGVAGETLVFGLPGNPVSALVTFVLFVAPALSALAGERVEGITTGTATLSSPVRRNPQREQAVRVRLESHDGRLVATPNGPQGSHLISSLLGAEALALIAPGDGVLDAGAPVELALLPR